MITNWKEQLDEFSSSVVWLLQRNCISETQQAETKKLLPLAVDLWSGSDWCCIAANSSRNEWWNKQWNDETSDQDDEAEKLPVCIFNPAAVLHCISLSTCSCLFSHCFLQNSAVCVFVSPNSDVSSSVWPRVTPACQASVDERKETNWCSWETSVKYCPPVSNFYIVRVLKKNKHSTVVCELGRWWQDHQWRML